MACEALLFYADIILLVSHAPLLGFELVAPFLLRVLARSVIRAGVNVLLVHLLRAARHLDTHIHALAALEKRVYEKV